MKLDHTYLNDPYGNGLRDKAIEKMNEIPNREGASVWDHYAEGYLQAQAEAKGEDAIPVVNARWFFKIKDIGNGS